MTTPTGSEAAPAMAETKPSEFNPPMENHYMDPITKLSPDADELLDKYAHIPEEERLGHVHAMVHDAYFPASKFPPT
jgi:hypothetical protein